MIMNWMVKIWRKTKARKNKKNTFFPYGKKVFLNIDLFKSYFFVKKSFTWSLWTISSLNE